MFTVAVPAVNGIVPADATVVVITRIAATARIFFITASPFAANNSVANKLTKRCCNPMGSQPMFSSIPTKLAANADCTGTESGDEREGERRRFGNCLRSGRDSSGGHDFSEELEVDRNV